MNKKFTFLKVLCIAITLGLTSAQVGCGDRGVPTHSDAGVPRDAQVLVDAGTTNHPRTGFQILSPQGGTVTSVLPASGGGLAGGGTSGALTMSLLMSCSTSQVLVYNGSAWACGAAGITNAAGANVVPVSLGAGSNLGSSSIKDDGTTVSINTSKFTVTESSGNTFVAGTLTGSGAEVAQSSFTVWGALTGSGNVTLGGSAANSIAFNGSASTTLDMNNHKILDVTNGTSAQDAAAFGQIASGVNAAVSGTSGRSTRFTAANAVGTGAFTDDSTNVSMSGSATFTPSAGKSFIVAADATNARSVTFSDNAQVVQFAITFPGANVSRYRYLTGGVDVWQADSGGNFEIFNAAHLDSTVTANNTATGVAADVAEFNSQTNGTQDATAADRSAYGVFGSSNSSRSAGSHNVINYGVYGTATNGQVNYSGYFNTGLFHVVGAATFDSTVSLGGALNMNSHQINGVSNGSVSSDAAAFGQLATAVNAAVAGTSGRSTRFSGTNAVGNGAFTDDGTNATTNGNLTSTAGTTTVGAVAYTTITPTTITGTVNDFNPTSFGTSTVARVASSSGVPTITGLTAGVSGRIYTIFNVDASNNLLIACNNAGSLAANRITGPWGTTNLTLTAGANSNVSMIYDSTSSRYRVVGLVSETLPTLTVTGTALFNGNVSLGDASADQISFLGSAATALNMNAHLINGVTDPVSAQDVLTLNYFNNHTVVGTGSGSANFVTAWTGTSTIAKGALQDNGTYTTQNETVEGTTVDNTTFNTAGLVNNYAFPASKHTVVINTNNTAQITGIAAPSENYRHISIKNHSNNCMTVYDDNGNSTITNRIKLEYASTGFVYFCPQGTLDCDYDQNLGATTPGRWACAVTFANDSPGNMTIDGELNVSSDAKSSVGFLTDGTGTTFVFPGHIGFGYSTAGAATGYINSTGYIDGTGSARSLEIDDGQGSGSGGPHMIAYFNALDHTSYFTSGVFTQGLLVASSGLTVNSGGAAFNDPSGAITFTNEPIGGEGQYTGKHIEGVDDWMNGASGLTGGPTPLGHGYIFLTSGVAAQTTTHTPPSTPIAGRPGILSMANGTSSNGLIEINSDSGAVNFGDGKWSYNAVVNWPTLSGSASAGVLYVTEIGFWDSNSMDQVDGCYFSYDHGNLATSGPNTSKVNNLECWCAANSVRTTYLMAGVGSGSAGDGSATLGSAAVVAATFMNLEVDVDASIPEADFKVNGTKMCQIKTNIPTGTSRLTDFGVFHQQKGSSTLTSESVDVDFTKWAVDLTSVRSP